MKDVQGMPSADALAQGEVDLEHDEQATIVREAISELDQFRQCIENGLKLVDSLELEDHALEAKRLAVSHLAAGLKRCAGIPQQLLNVMPGLAALAKTAFNQQPPSAANSRGTQIDPPCGAQDGQTPTKVLDPLELIVKTEAESLMECKQVESCHQPAKSSQKATVIRDRSSEPESLSIKEKHISKKSFLPETSTSKSDEHFPTRSKRTFHCLDCKKSFHTQSKLNSHMMVHSGEKPFNCDICTTTFRFKSDWKRHHLRAHSGINRFKCEKCDRSFYFQYDLTTHMTSHTGEKPFQCGFCPKTFRFKSNMKTHLIAVHKVISFKEPKPDQLGNSLKTDEDNEAKRAMSTNLLHKKKFSCAQCRRSFPSKHKLKIHLRSHTGEKPFVCEVCSKKFRYKPNLDRHHHEAHGDHEKYSCDLCDKSYTQLSSLKEHRTIHTGEMRHMCNICGKGFRTNSSFHHHKKSHEIRGREDDVKDDKAKANCTKFQCKECGKFLSSSQNLNVHMQRHKGVLSYFCKTCSKGFLTGSELKIHERIHTGEHPFKCDQCDKSFYTKGNLSRHLITHVKDKAFQCGMCHKSFAAQLYLDTHKIMHNDRKFSCNICHKVFNTQTPLSKHRKLHLKNEPGIAK